MSKNERINRVLHDHVALIRDAFPSQEEILAALAERLCAGFHQGGRLFTCGSGPLTLVADLAATLFVYRMGFDRPALPAISLSRDQTLLHALSRDGQGRQIFARQLRPLATEADLLLIFADQQTDPALNEALAMAQRIGMTTAVLVPARNELIGEEPPSYVFRLETNSIGRLVEGATVFSHMLCELVEVELFGH